MGTFLNEFDANMRVAIVVFIMGAAPTFGYFFNKLIDSLKNEYEHHSLYVAIGTVITLLFVALLSWKAAVIALAIFTLTGTPMVVGEFIRTEKKAKTTRRKRLPYAANGLLKEAKEASELAHILMTKAINSPDENEHYKNLIAAALQINTITDKLHEVKQIQEK